MITKKVAKGIEKLSESCVESWFEAGLVGPGPDADECHAKLKERILQAIEGLMDRRYLVVQALDN